MEAKSLCWIQIKCFTFALVCHFEQYSTAVMLCQPFSHGISVEDETIHVDITITGVLAMSDSVVLKKKIALCYKYVRYRHQNNTILSAIR